MRYFAFLILLTITGTTAHAFNIATDAHFFDLSAWDHAQIKNGQQTFENVYEDVDVTISVTGDFSLPTGVLPSGWVHSSNVIVGAQQFTFTFSEPIPLVIQHDTTDPSEEFRVLDVEVDDYEQQRGAPVELTTLSNGISLTGTAFRLVEDGAARGYLLTQPVKRMVVEHVSFSANKFERFKVGANTVFVPEPRTLGLLWIGCLCLLRRWR